jgi:predicted ATPase
MARLDRLGTAKEVAQTAAALGREFSYALLRAVSPLSEDALQAELGQLADAELVYARGVPPEATYLFRHALVQDTAYESLLKSRRRELHRAVAETLSGRVAGVAEAQPEVVAQHWEAAGEAERAMAAWQQAGERAKDRGAAIEAERHYTRALAVLATLPDGPTRMSQELALQIPLSWVMDFTHGKASSERARASARIRELSAQVGDTQQLLMALMLAFGSIQARGQAQAAVALAEEVLAAARRDGSTFALTWGHYIAGASRYSVGDLAGAGEHVTEALRFYREEDHRGWPSEPGTLAHAMLGFVQAQQGLPERARGEIGRLLALTERLEMPSQRPFGYLSVTAGNALLRNAEVVATQAERFLALAVENQLAVYLGWGPVYRGWARAMLDRTDEGIAELREGLAAYAATGQRTALGQYLGFLAEAQLVAGLVPDGLATIEQALAAVPEERIHIPELLRLRGELRAVAGADVATVEASYREAIALARDLGAKLQVLRATTSLARLLQTAGRAAEAHASLAPLYASFTEGFDTRDLKDAKALLDDLA